MFRVTRAWPAALLGLLILSALSACTGGGGTTTAGGTGSFDLRITTDKTSGPSPLTVSFFVTPSGGTAPYTYAWDFNDDGVVDSNAPSGQYTYQADAIARVTVTDAAQTVMTASQSITITTGTPPPPGSPLTVRFNASPQVGRVPFDVQFSPVVSGGRAPYSYAWDFEGDGRYDQFTEAPLHRYTEVGTKISADHYAFFPVLKVTDSRGITETNLQDIDGTPGPDFLQEIQTLTPEQSFFAVAFANPQAGQAPLTVEFNANVGGGSGGTVRYSWDFGDNTTSSPSSTSSVTHTYQAAGTYLARVTAQDQSAGLTAVSAPVTITATQGQPFNITVNADIKTGQVPFVVNFSANPVNGQEPIQYEWNVFDDDPANPNPGPGNPPTLSARAVVTPSLSERKDPSIHFGNTSSDLNAAHTYRVRVTATDALGSQRTSDWIKITALPHTQPAPGAGGEYTAKRPQVVDQTIFPVDFDPTLTANAAFLGDGVTPAQMQQNGYPHEWSARANAAVCSHPSGVTFIIGGEHLASNGTFQGLVSRGDSNYAYVPTDVEAADARGTQFGKYGTTVQGTVQNGGVVKLNDGLGPSFPNTPVSDVYTWQPSPNDPIGRQDTVVPPILDPQEPPAHRSGLAKVNRSTPFTIVGSATACFMHEPPESNQAGLYPPPITQLDPGGIDVGFLGVPWYGWADSPNSSPPWSNDILSNPPSPGLGNPVIYVIGGRTGATNPVDLVQKYYVYGFGSEDEVPYSIDYGFQATGNQTDIWSNYFLRPDQDQFPGSGTNFDPQIQQRTEGGGGNQTMPHLPVPLYGHMAVRLQSGIDVPSPSFPQGGYAYIFVMGGIDDTGAVQDKMYWWDTSKGLEPGQDPGMDGVFSDLPAMPQPRAYGQAVLMATNPLRIAVVGGFDENNNPLTTVDIYTFGDPFNPVQGTWSTFQGSLEEAIRSTAVGWNPGTPGDPYVLTFGGFETTDFTGKLRSFRLGSGVTVTEATPVVPRAYHAASQGGGAGIGVNELTFNRYYVVGGVTEQGTSNILEVASLP